MCSLLNYIGGSISRTSRSGTVFENAIQSCLQVPTLSPETIAKARMLRARSRLTCGAPLGAQEGVSSSLGSPLQLYFLTTSRSSSGIGSRTRQCRSKSPSTSTICYHRKGKLSKENSKLLVRCMLCVIASCPNFETHYRETAFYRNLARDRHISITQRPKGSFFRILPPFSYRISAPFPRDQPLFKWHMCRRPRLGESRDT